MKKFLLCLLALVCIAQWDAAAGVIQKINRAASAVAMASRSVAFPSQMIKSLPGAYDDLGNGVANYYVLLSDNSSAQWTKEDGAILTDGYVLSIDLYGPTSSPIEITPGTYAASAGSESMTYSPEYSYMTYYNESGEAQDFFDITGNIEVAKTADGYSITLSVDGKPVTFSGSIDFDDGTVAPSIYNQIKKDLDFQCIGALCNYDGNLYESNTGAMYINLYEKNYNEETGGMIDEGYSVALLVYGKLFSDSKNATLDPGTYTIARNFKRYTFYPGMEIDYMGTTVVFGTYAKEFNTTRYADRFGYSYINDGTITIEDLGEGVYKILVDATTTYGHSVKVSYEGPIKVVDKSDDTGSTALSTLEDDVQLNLDQIPVARAYNSGKVNNQQTFLVDVGSPSGLDGITEGDIMRMEFVLPDGTQRVQAGTYTVMEDKFDSFYQPFTLGRGRFVAATGGGTDLSGTRYQNFEAGRYLVMKDYAPAAAGTVGVTVNDDDTYTFDIHIVDDAQFRIDGSWTGPVKLMYNPDQIASISEITADNSAIGIKWLDDVTLLVTGIDNIDSAALYNVVGMSVRCDVEGNIIKLDGLGRGVYVLNVNGKSIKIVKK